MPVTSVIKSALNSSASSYDDSGNTSHLFRFECVKVGTHAYKKN